MTRDDARHNAMYGRAHRALRAQWKVKVAQGNVRCVRCHQLIPPDRPGQRSQWHLDHVPGFVDRWNGPCHRRCNEVGVLPGQPIAPQTAPPGPGRGRPTAEERLQRDLDKANRDGGRVMPATHPGRGTIREMDGQGPRARGPHMAGPHRRDNVNLSQHWPGHCDCRPGEAELHAAYLAHLDEQSRVLSKLCAAGRHAEARQWLREHPDPYEAARTKP